MGEACEPVGLRRGCGLARDRKESGQKEQKHSFLEATTRRRTSLPRVSGTMCMGHGAEHTAGPRPALPGVPADTPRPKELCGAPRSLRLQHRGLAAPSSRPPHTQPGYAIRQWFSKDALETPKASKMFIKAPVNRGL